MLFRSPHPERRLSCFLGLSWSLHSSKLALLRNQKRHFPGKNKFPTRKCVQMVKISQKKQVTNCPKTGNHLDTSAKKPSCIPRLRKTAMGKFRSRTSIPVNRPEKTPLPYWSQKNSAMRHHGNGSRPYRPHLAEESIPSRFSIRFTDNSAHRRNSLSAS